MKKALYFLVIVLSSAARAQDELKVKLNDLYIPSLPGFILADKAPASIERPATARAFGLSLLNLWEGGGVEVTPYWLTNKPRYTFDQWIDKRATLLESFNLSIASFKTDTSSVLSGGIRSQLFRIYSPEARTALRAWKDTLIALLTPVDEHGDPLPLDLAAIKRAHKKLDDLRNKGLFSFELAAAVLGSSLHNDFKGLTTARSGIWANLRWSPWNFPLDLIGLTRYSWAGGESKSGRDTAFLDYGLSLSLERSSYNLSVEYVRRNDISLQQGTERLVLVGNYMLNENVVLVASVGKNFSGVDNIITLFGVKFGLSRSPEK